MKAMRILMTAATMTATVGGVHAETRVIDRSADDVSVVIAESARIELDRPVEIPWQDCKPRQDRSNRVFWDCTAAFEWTYGFPSMHQVIFSDEDFNANRLGAGKFSCELLRVTVASEVAAVRNSQGVGFWYEGFPNGGGLHLIPRARLVQVALAELKDGRETYLHRFVGLANCSGGGPMFTALSRYGFKPYMQFADGETVFRNWDLYEGNYWVGPQFKFLDRTRDVLRFP